MKFKSTTNEVKKALQILSPIVNHNHQILAYRYLMITKNADRLEFKAFDTSVIGSAFVKFSEIKEESEDRYYVLAKHLMGLVSSFSNADLTFTLNEDRCKLRCGKSNYTLQTLDKKIADESLNELEIDYYDDFFKSKKTSEVKIERFSTCFNSVNHCLSKDDSQKNLQNIYFADSRILACDGVKGACLPFDTKGIEHLSLHKKACDCILNLNSSNIHLFREEDKVYGKTENFVFVSTIDGDYPYPDISSIIDGFNADSFESVVKIDPDEITDKLSRVLMFADEDTNAVSITFDEEELVILVDNKNQAREVINAFENIKKQSMSLFLDGKSLKESLNKALVEAKWYSDGESEVQYIYDGDLLQFFLGLG